MEFPWLLGVMVTLGVISVCTIDHWPSPLSSPMQVCPTPPAQRPPHFHYIFHGLDVLLLSLQHFSVHTEKGLVDDKKQISGFPVRVEGYVSQKVPF